MPKEITDPALLQQLEAQPVTDPALLLDLEGRKSEPGVMDRLLGRGTERYQTWPEVALKTAATGLNRGIDAAVNFVGNAPEAATRSAWSGLTFPRDVMAGKASPEDTGRALDLAALGMPINPAVRAGERAIHGLPMARAAAETPAAAELKNVGGTQIGAAREMGVEFHPETLPIIGEHLRQRFERRGIFPDATSGAPGTYAQLARMAARPTPGEGERAFTGFDNLQSAREAFAGIAGDFRANPRDRLAATEAIRVIDGFIARPPAGTVLAGPAAEAGATYAKGRGNYSAAERVNEVTGELDRAATGIVDRADLGANVASSTNRFEDKARQAAASILRSPKEIRGWNDPEVAALTQIAEGTGTRNFLRRTSTLPAITAGAATVGSTIGLGTMNPVLGALATAIYPAIAYSGRGLGNMLTRRELRALDKMTRQRSPLFLEREAEAQNVPFPVAPREAVLRALLEARPSQ